MVLTVGDDGAADAAAVVDAVDEEDSVEEVGVFEVGSDDVVGEGVWVADVVAVVDVALPEKRGSVNSIQVPRYRTVSPSETSSSCGVTA